MDISLSRGTIARAHSYFGTSLQLTIRPSSLLQIRFSWPRQISLLESLLLPEEDVVVRGPQHHKGRWLAALLHDSAVALGRMKVLSLD